ncbi:MAG: ABC transporter ATP-binding protein [Crocinitomicaceae bacterium]|nr:ABC transporter ATP-binding protein [Crocinitomicaceae bacterium]|tara:strand:+ start:9477 stop:10460 length:984 start_codon:yes stop_codon:yes gene_type:complete
MLKVKGLHKRFVGERTRLVLKGINFQVNKGQHIFIIGETGSGKSTLLKSIYGIYTPDKGKIWLENKQLEFGKQLIPGFDTMKLVEQDYNLKKFNTVRSAIESRLEVGLTKKSKTEKTNELLELFELRKLASRQILEISGGQQQRLALAQAFSQLPKLLLLDEPFAHLDPQLKTNIFRYLEKCIREEEVTVLTVTHDYNETLKHANWVIAMENGKIAQQGSVRELYNNPVNLYVAGLLGSFTTLELEDSVWLIRPEYVSISGKGKYSGVLKSIRFGGGHFELEVDYKNQVLVGLSLNDTELKEGQHVQFNLNLCLRVDPGNKIVSYEG